MGKKSDHPAEAPHAQPFNSPFASLAGRVAAAPPTASPSVAASAPPAKTKRAGPQRAVVRYERKGHGGKEMTRIEQLELPARELERWLKELKQALGCGGVLEGATLLVQGDQRERVRAWLERRGVSRVTVS